MPLKINGFKVLKVLKVWLWPPLPFTYFPPHLPLACFLLDVTVFPVRKSWVQLLSFDSLVDSSLSALKESTWVVFFVPHYQTSGILEKVFLMVLPVMMQTWAPCTERDKGSEGKTDDYMASLTNYQVHGLQQSK